MAGGQVRLKSSLDRVYGKKGDVNREACECTRLDSSQYLSRLRLIILDQRTRSDRVHSDETAACELFI